MNDQATKQCRQPGCGGPASGICLERFSFDECPNLNDLVRMAEAVAAEVDPVVHLVADDTATDLVSVSPGASLGLKECDSLLRRQDAVLVSLIAGPAAGKTTLIATMYELARRGALKNLAFAGSDSIRGFEERCHLSRETSGSEQADTQRTRGGPPQFLHLRLANDDSQVDFLLSDRAGEFVTRVLDNPASIGTYPEVVRADQMALLVDGVELQKNYPQTASYVKRIHQALLQNDLLDRPLHLVITKADLFEGDELEQLKRRAQGLVNFFSTQHHSVAMLHLTGARSRKGGTTFGEGIEPLLLSMLPKPTVRRYSIGKFSSAKNANDALGRMMDALRGAYD